MVSYNVGVQNEEIQKIFTKGTKYQRLMADIKQTLISEHVITIILMSEFGNMFTRIDNDSVVCALQTTRRKMLPFDSRRLCKCRPGASSELRTNSLSWKTTQHWSGHQCIVKFTFQSVYMFPVKWTRAFYPTCCTGQSFSSCPEGPCTIIR